MKKIISRPEFDTTITFLYEKGERVTWKDVKNIAGDLCNEADDPNVSVLAEFEIYDKRVNTRIHAQSMGVRKLDYPFSPREHSNIGKFVVKRGGHYARDYSNPDGKHGDEISDEIDLDVIEEILRDYTHLYSVSWNDYSSMSVNLCDDNIIPTIKKELDEYLKVIDGEFLIAEEMFNETFKRTLEFFSGDDLFYGVIAKEYQECVDNTHPNDAPDEKVYSIAKEEVDILDKFFNEPQFGTTMDNDLNDWCYGYYNDEYGVIDQIISQCIRPMHDRGLISFVD